MASGATLGISVVKGVTEGTAWRGGGRGVDVIEKKKAAARMGAAYPVAFVSQTLRAIVPQHACHAHTHSPLLPRLPTLQSHFASAALLLGALNVISLTKILISSERAALIKTAAKNETA